MACLEEWGGWAVCPAIMTYYHLMSSYHHIIICISSCHQVVCREVWVACPEEWVVWAVCPAVMPCHVMSSAHRLISSCHVISSHATISYLPHHVTRWHARRDGRHARRDGWYGWYGGPGRPGRRSTAAATAEGDPAEEGPHAAQGAKGGPPLANHNPLPLPRIQCAARTKRPGKREYVEIGRRGRGRSTNPLSRPRSRRPWLAPVVAVRSNA